MIVCDRCCKSNANRTYITVSAAKGSTNEVSMDAQRDLCVDCRVALTDAIDRFLLRLPLVAAEPSNEAADRFRQTSA